MVQVCNPVECKDCHWGGWDNELAYQDEKPVTHEEFFGENIRRAISVLTTHKVCPVCSSKNIDYFDTASSCSSWTLTTSSIIDYNDKDQEPVK